MNAIRSRSRSTTMRVATDCTRPADSCGMTFFQSTGDTLKGLVDGMSPGSHTLRVTLADGSLLQQPVINHPNGGPVFSGPQIQPWTCNNEAATDAQCTQPAEYRFKYVPADKLRAFISGFDPMNPGLPGP